MQINMILKWKWKFNMTCQGEWTPKTKGTITKVFSISCPNLVILAWMGDKYFCRQAQNGVNLKLKVKFEFEGQGQSSHKINWGLNQGLLHLWSKFCDPSQNEWWVIALTKKLTDGRTRTDGWIHRQMQATIIHKVQNWLRVTICSQNPL